MSPSSAPASVTAMPGDRRFLPLRPTLPTGQRRLAPDPPRPLGNDGWTSTRHAHRARTVDRRAALPTGRGPGARAAALQVVEGLDLGAEEVEALGEGLVAAVDDV